MLQMLFADRSPIFKGHLPHVADFARAALPAIGATHACTGGAL